MIGRALPLLVASWVFAAAGSVIQVLLARELGPSAFGFVGLALSVVSFANVVQASGTPQAVSLAAAGNREHPRGALSEGLRRQARTSAALAIVLVLAAPALATLFGEPNLRWGLWVLAAMVPGFGVMVTLGGYWNGRQRFTRQAGVTITYAIAKLGLVLGLAWNLGPLGALMGYALSPLFGLAFGLPGVGRRPATPRVRLPRAVPLILVSLASLALYTTDLYIVRLLVQDSAAAGHYVAAQSIALIPIMVATPFAQVVMPRVAQSMPTHNRAAAGLAISQALRQAGLIIVPGSAALSAAAPQLTRFLYGNEFVEASVIARMLVLSTAVVGLLLVVVGGLSGAGRAPTAVACLLVALLTSVGSGAILVELWGPVGAAVGVGGGATIGLVAVLVVLRRMSALGAVGLATIVRAVAAGLLAFVMVAAAGDGAAGLAALALSSLLVIGFYWYSGELSAEERGRVLTAITLRMRG